MDLIAGVYFLNRSLLLVPSYSKYTMVTAYKTISKDPYERPRINIAMLNDKWLVQNKYYSQTRSSVPGVDKTGNMEHSGTLKNKKKFNENK